MCDKQVIPDACAGLMTLSVYLGAFYVLTPLLTPR